MIWEGEGMQNHTSYIIHHTSEILYPTNFGVIDI